MRYIGDGTPWPEERSRQFVERQIALFDQRGFCLWKLVARLHNEAPVPIGFCGLQPLPESEEIEIGWWLARAWWGRGLATSGGGPGAHRSHRTTGKHRFDRHYAEPGDGL